MPTKLTYGLQHSTVISLLVYDPLSLASVSIERLIISFWVGHSSRIWQTLAACIRLYLMWRGQGSCKISEYSNLSFNVECAYEIYEN